MKLLLAALLTFGAAVPLRAAAEDTAPPEVHSITFNREQITVSGLEVRLLVATVHLTDEIGIDEGDHPERGPSPYLSLGPGHGMALTLGRGTPQDGWYTGGVAVTSAWSGDYRPTHVYVRDQQFNETSVDVSKLGIDLPTVAVTSSNRPKLELIITPNPANVGDAINRGLRVTDAAGKPWPGVPVQMSFDNECVEHFTSVPDGRTNASGVFTDTPLPAGQQHNFLICARIVSDVNVPEQYPTFLAVESDFPTYRYRVSATPAATSAPAGSSVAVNGNLVPGQQGKELELQRLYAPGDWRTVNRGKTTPASRFTISATPPGTSLYSYRVFAPAGTNRAAAYSPVFTIRGT